MQFSLFIGPTGKVNDKLLLAACFAFIPVTGHGNYTFLAEMIVILYDCAVYIYDEGDCNKTKVYLVFVYARITMWLY